MEWLPNRPEHFAVARNFDYGPPPLEPGHHHQETPRQEQAPAAPDAPPPEERPRRDPADGEPREVRAPPTRADDPVEAPAPAPRPSPFSP